MQILPDYQLIDAAKEGNTDKALDAIERGANVNFRDHHKLTPLYHALTRGNTELGELLVRHGADVNLTYGHKQEALLHWAARESASGVAHFLMRHLVDVNRQRIDGATPLIVASRKGNYYMVKLLLENKAKLNIKTTSNISARSVAEREGHLDILSLIDKAYQYRPDEHLGRILEDNGRSGERFLF